MSTCVSKTPVQKKRVLLVMGWYDYRLHRGIANYAEQHGWQADCGPWRSGNPRGGTSWRPFFGAGCRTQGRKGPSGPHGTVRHNRRPILGENPGEVWENPGHPGGSLTTEERRRTAQPRAPRSLRALSSARIHQQFRPRPGRAVGVSPDNCTRRERPRHLIDSRSR